MSCLLTAIPLRRSQKSMGGGSSSTSLRAGVDGARPVYIGSSLQGSCLFFRRCVRWDMGWAGWRACPIFFTGVVRKLTRCFRDRPRQGHTLSSWCRSGPMPGRRVLQRCLGRERSRSFVAGATIESLIKWLTLSQW